MQLEIPTYESLPHGVIPDRLVVERALYEAEAPVLYLTRTIQGQLLLAYLADDNLNGTFTILTPVSSQTLSLLENGAISVRDVIQSSASWLHWVGINQVRSWALDFSDFPQEFLPEVGTPLYPEQEPILKTRAIGPLLTLGRMPASVVSFVADATRRAMKTILDYTLNAKPDGRPRDEHRSLYDLPITAFRFASFEIGFGLPEEGLFTSDQVREAAEKLNRGLKWASTFTTTPLDGEPDEREAILRATLLLTPPSSGYITQVDVSGTWISQGTVSLTKNSRRRVRDALRTVDSERLFTISGRLGEIDTDKLTFILRDTSDGSDRSGSFSEDLLEEMIALLTESVEVAGIERQGRLNVTAVVASP